MAITEHDVQTVAQLARLVIADARLPEIVGELNRILQHMDVLQNAAIPSIASEVLMAPSQAQRSMPLRDDVNAPVQLQERRASFAPAFRDGFFLVPRLGTHADEADE